MLAWRDTQLVGELPGLAERGVLPTQGAAHVQFASGTPVWTARKEQ